MAFHQKTGRQTAATKTIRRFHKKQSSSLASTQRSSFFFKSLTLSIALLLSGITVVYAQQIKADPSAAGNNRPVIDNTANGLPLIQIATPNASGLSHNQYQQFNIDQNGAILNNASNHVKTELGGWIDGNPNLPNSGAHIILNEVTSANPSTLNGYLEVAGQRAEVIVSNPNGILVNGFGFINASRGVLSTGVPVFSGNGSLEAFRVTQGAIKLDSSGFNDQATDQVDLITRSVQINGELHTNQLNVITGANQVNYADLGVQLIQASDHALTVAIDIAALGGMYANKIKLVGTEAGVGVVSYGRMAATGGDFHLDSAGKVTLVAATDAPPDKTGTSATGNLHITSAKSISNQAKLSSSGNMNLHAVAAIDNHGQQILSDGNLAMSSATLNNTGGTLKSRRSAKLALRSDYVHSQGDTLAAVDDLAIDIKGDFSNHSELVVGGKLTVHATNIENDKDALLSAAGTSLLQADQELTNTGRIYAEDIAIGAQTLNNDHQGSYGDTTPAGVIAARNKLDIGAKHITNREHALLKSDGNMAIGGALDANNKATGTSTSVLNSSATIDSGSKLIIDSTSLINTNAHFASNIQLDPSKTRSWTEYEIDGNPTVYTPNQVAFLPGRDVTKLVVNADASRYNDYTTRNIVETVRKTVVTQTDPARILSHSDMTLTGGTVSNDKSAIVAGATLSGQIDGASNGGSNPQGQLLRYRDIVSIHHTTEKCGAFGSKRCNKENTVQIPVNFPVTHFDLGIWQAQANTLPDSNTNPSIAPNIKELSDNQLYRPLPIATPGLSYLVETDPAFTGLRNFLSSDYLLNRMGMNPQTIQKRLGDGYYEQKRINDQILQLTGRKTLGVYASNEAQYQALMNAGATYAQTFQLMPGIALSAEQMATLTTDLVWLVEKNITVADGSMHKALAPVVYLSQLHAQDLKPGGALISANNIDLKLHGTLDNAGTLKANDKLSINTGQDIQNTLGTITSQNGNITLLAERDINNQSGIINGNRVGMLAGRDINVGTTANTNTGIAGTQTSLDRTGRIDASDLTMQARHDIKLDAAHITTTGDATLIASNNLDLNTVKTQDELNVTYDEKNHLYKRQEQANGTSITTGANAMLEAGNELNSQAAYVNAGQNLTAKAGGNINLGATTQSNSYDQEVYTASSNILSSHSKHSQDRQTGTQAIGSTFSGDSVTVQAGQKLNLTGSNVVSTNDAKLSAVDSINIIASQDTAHQTYSKEERTSGVFSGGGIGVTIGSRTLNNKQTSEQVSNNASTIGSTHGKVSMTAGKTYTQTASHVLAPTGDIDIAAQQININAAHDTNDSRQETHFQQSGLTLQITNPVISAIQSIQQIKRASEKTQDSRMQGLAAGAAALTVANAVAQVADSAAPAGGIELAASFGTSKSDSYSEQHSTIAAGSTAAAGGNIHIAASGAGKDSHLTVQGSEITAGNNATLTADNQINLLAAQSNHELHSNNSSRSTSIGGSIGTSGPMGNASASGSRGHGDGSDVRYTNSHIKEGNLLAMTAGGNTDLKGATASGQQVSAEVGGNLHIESLQDESHYNSQQRGWGGSIAVGTSKISGSINASRSKVNGTYLSVQEQSGIATGDGGFQVEVKGHTNLQGSQIASTDQAIEDGKNRFTTATLTTSDIFNKSDYHAQSQSISAGAGYGGGNRALNGTGLGLGNVSGDENSQTRSGISDIAGDITVRSDKDSSGKLIKNWDGQQLQEDVKAQAQIMEAFGKQAALGIGNYATSRLNDLNRQIEREIEPIKKAQLQEEAKNWAEGGTYRVALHTATGALTGGLAGAAGAATSALAMPVIAERINQMEVPQVVKQGLNQVAAAALGATVGGVQGLASSVHVEANNRQLHETEKQRIKREIAPRYAAAHPGMTVEQASTILEAQLLRQVDVAAGAASGWNQDASSYLAVYKAAHSGESVGKDQWGNPVPLFGVAAGYQRIDSTILSASPQTLHPPSAPSIGSIGDYFKGMAKGIEDTALHPVDTLVDTAKGIYNAITDPQGTTDRAQVAARHVIEQAAQGNFIPAGQQVGQQIAATALTTTVGVAGVKGFIPTVNYLGVKTGMAVKTPYGLAWQSLFPEALMLRQPVKDGAPVFRAGTLGLSEIVEGQFWAMENPITAPNYAARYGIPPQNMERLNFVERGVVKQDSPFIIRPAPGIQGNAGGAFEVVVPSKGVKVDAFNGVGGGK